jgi:NADH-quinone oxidoreductase subunit N
MNFFSTYLLFIQNWLILRFDLIDFYQLNQQMDFLLLQENHIKMILPEVFLATSILVVTLHSSLLTTSRHFGFPLLTQSFSKLCILILLLTFLLVNNNPLMFMLIYQNTFIFDLLTANVKQILLIGTIFCLFISEDIILQQKINNFEYFLLILCSILGLMLLVSSYDMISLYLALEMQSLCLYVLAASKRDSSFSTEAGLKYFILGSFSSALLLLGISFLYGCSGTTNFDCFYLLFSGINPENFLLTASIEKALLCIGAAFFFKISAAPFHMWSPDVYEGSPTSSTIFFAIIPKIALFSVFLRLFQTIAGTFEESFQGGLIFFSIASVVIGSFVALRQKKLKRLLAYSSVSHVGYLLLAFSANSFEGTNSLFFYLITYMITSFCLWSIILSLTTRKNKEKSKTLIDLAATSNSNPVLGITAMLSVFSLAGVPPLVGFFAKMEIFVSALSSSLLFISLIAILSSVISSFYYIRLIKNIYFEVKEKNVFILPVTRACSLTMGLSLFFLLFLFANPSLVLLVTQKMTLCLF